MGDFRKGGEKHFGGHGDGFNRRDGGRRGFNGNRDRGPVTMHQAICAQCGKPCEVPFVPTSGKPVYCNTCFADKKGAGSNRDRDRFPQKNYDGYRAPVKSNFGGGAGQGNNYELKKQLEILNTKMDRLIRIMETTTSAKSLVAKKKPKETIKTTPAAKTKKLSKKNYKK